MFSRISRAAGLGSGEAEGGQASRIGPDVTISGDVETTGRLHLEGKVSGDLRCAVLSQSESGTIHGNILAEEARLAGLVDGGVEAGALTLDATARITGDVIYESLSVARGAEVEGRFRRRRPGDHGSLGARAAIEAPPEGPFPPPAVVAAE